MYQFLGIGIYYAQNLGTIVRDLCDIKANGCNTVPRVTEKIVEGIMKEGAKFTGLKKKMFDKAVELGRRFEHNNANGWFYNLELKVLDKYVYKHWREDFFGGEMKFLGCGGAAISPNLSRMLWAAGIKVCEGYGLTETSPIIAHADINHHRFSSVGPVVSNETVKIDEEDGEILVKGPNVMKGYYMKPELTKEVIDEDGWLHTGDIAHIDKDGYIFITGRIKNMIVLSGGKKVFPEEVENVMETSEHFKELCVFGTKRKGGQKDGSEDVTIAVVPKDEWVEGLSDEEALEKIKKEVKRLSQRLSHFKRPVNVFLSREPFPRTATTKIKRNEVKARYKDL